MKTLDGMLISDYDAFYIYTFFMTENMMPRPANPGFIEFAVSTMAMIAMLTQITYSVSNEYCLNSINGPDRIIDSKGNICSLIEVDRHTGCCINSIEGSLQSICADKAQCDDHFPCCNTFESCIGCCLHQQDPEFMEETINTPLRSKDRLKQLEIEQEYFPHFSHCRNQCRKAPYSTFEMNKYSNYPPQYCYEADLSKYEEPMALLNHISGGNTAMSIVKGDIGATCDSACQWKDAKCVDDYELNDKVINRCATLMKYFGKACKVKGCMFGFETVMPIVDEKHQNCFLQATLSKTTGGYPCDGSDPMGRRLCLCEAISESERQCLSTGWSSGPESVFQTLKKLLFA